MLRIAMAVWKIANMDHEMIITNMRSNKPFYEISPKRTSKIIKKDSTKIIYTPDEK